MFDLQSLIRPNIRSLKAYRSARDEFSGKAEVYLDANEKPTGDGLHRYPDSAQIELKTAIAQSRACSPESLFLGNGSDEVIDLLMRAFCNPGKDHIACFTPTYGMYRVSADIQDAHVVEVPLDASFHLPPLMQLPPEVFSAKLVFLCSPNNPTGNLLQREALLNLAKQCKGLVVIDEAYIDFTMESSLSWELKQYPNLVILQTFSKAWGLAGIRLGLGIARPEVIQILDSIRPPYNINSLTAERAKEALANQAEILIEVQDIIRERDRLSEALQSSGLVKQIWPSDANFLLVEFEEADAVFQALLAQQIVVRNRSGQVPGALRITVGTAAENDALISALKVFEQTFYPSS